MYETNEILFKRLVIGWFKSSELCELQNLFVAFHLIFSALGGCFEFLIENLCQI